ncbi:MAG: 3-deoxy-manno-octulosonate cytidylyltransferase [Bacteroidota bacterium]
MKTLGVIPARYASTRFPGKPLAVIHGKTMIQRVYEQAKLAVSLDEVYVATDDQRIFAHVESFGGKVLMTDSLHQSGTDRCNEVREILEEKAQLYDVVINIQGDEPYINPNQIDQLAAVFKQKEIQIATLVKTIQSTEELNNVNVVKVVKENMDKAIYFSRYPIPFSRTGNVETYIKQGFYFKHIGIYAYRSSVLESICKLQNSKLEEIEALEQLRWIEHSYSIQTILTEHESIAIDTPEDLLKLTNNA